MRHLGMNRIVLSVLVVMPCVAMAQRASRPPSVFVEALDADKDGTISSAELENAAAALAKLDRNGDGKLSREETRPRSGGGRAPASIDSALEQSPMARDDAEKKILKVLDDLDRTQRRGNMNVPLPDGRLLRLLTESVKAKHVVEIGTSNGYSGIWMCLALRKTGGKLTTYEIDADRASLARSNFKRAGVDGLITLIEGDAHKEVTKRTEPIDVLFLDADKPGYIDYLEKLLPLVRPGGLILAHNMHRPRPDPRYIKAVTTDPDLETLFVHMDAAGMGITLKKR